MTNIKSKIIKIIIVLLLVQVIFAIENVSRAAIWEEGEEPGAMWNAIWKGGDDFINTGKDEANSGSITVAEGKNGDKTELHLPSKINLMQILSDIYSVLLPLGVAVTVIIGGIIGIKFMVASAEDKAELKKSLVPYVIGCIVIYGAFGIWKLCIELFSGIF